MNPIKTNLVLKVLVGALVFIMIPASVSSRVCANGAGGGYTVDEGESGLQTSLQSIDNSIEKSVIEGAGHYLKAYSEILALLNRVEESDLNGMDYNEARQISDRALANMTLAVKTYYSLIRRAEMTPYNEAVIAKLMDFDYAGFKEKWRLNSVVFYELEGYLKKGDITGMFKHIYGELLTITRQLYAVNSELSLEKMPELSGLWRLNESCAQLLIFAQYGSRVFYSVQNKVN